MRLSLLLAALLVIVAAASASAASAGISGLLARETLWKGNVSLSGPVEVPRGGVLTVVAGTTVRPLRSDAKLIVHGTLRVEGTEAAPVTFAAPAGWEGIDFRESEGSRIVRGRFFGAKTAVSASSSSFLLRECLFRNCETAVRLVRLSNPSVEECVFEENGIGVNQEMRSAPILRRNLFRGQRQSAVLSTQNCGGRMEGNRFEENRKGITLLRQHGGEIAGNTFRGNETAVFCEQTRSTPFLRGNLFERNRIGIAAVSFSSPRVEENRFVGNGTALRGDQLASPAVRHNLFRQNGTAVATLRRSAPKMEKNVLEGNGVGLFCDFSSYPQVSRNNFTGNRRGVELGANQSADFEKRFGSRAAAQRMSAARRGGAPGGPPQIAATGEEFIDVRGNWWGNDTRRLAAAGAQGNVDLFFDGSDRPTVTMEGYGQERFRLDRVRFHPWLLDRVPDAGPTGNKGDVKMNSGKNPEKGVKR